MGTTDKCDHSISPSVSRRNVAYIACYILYLAWDSHRIYSWT